MVLVVAYRWTDAILMATPGWSKAIGELPQRAVRIGIVTESEYRAVNVVQKLGGQLILVAIAAGNVAGPNETRIGRLCQNIGRQGYAWQGDRAYRL